MLPWQRHIRQLNHQKNKVCVVNLLAAIFGHQEIKVFREKGGRNTGIKNCVQPPQITIPIISGRSIKLHALENSRGLN